MTADNPSKSRFRNLAQLLMVVAVLLSFSVEMASTLIDAELNKLVLEEFGNESDSEGKVDFEIDSEVEKSHSRTYYLYIGQGDTENRLSQLSNLGLSYALSPLQQLDAPPPEV